MSLTTDNDVASDDELQELELQQRQLDIDLEHKQRHLDIDRKKMAIRKRRAKLQTPFNATPPPVDPTLLPVDLTLEDTEPSVKAEPEENMPTKTSPEPTRVPLPSPALTEATLSVPMSSAVSNREPIPDLEHKQDISEEGPSNEVSNGEEIKTTH